MDLVDSIRRPGSGLISCMTQTTPVAWVKFTYSHFTRTGMVIFGWGPGGEDSIGLMNLLLVKERSVITGMILTILQAWVMI